MKVKSFNIQVKWSGCVSCVKIYYRLSRHKKDRLMVLNFFNDAMTKKNIYKAFKARLLAV